MDADYPSNGVLFPRRNTRYGTDTDFRDGITEAGLAYVVGIPSSTSPWSPGYERLPPKPWSGRGRRTSAIRRDSSHQPVSAEQLALNLPKAAWRRVAWREGSNNAKLTSRFAAVRVRPAHREYHRSTPRPEEWCLIEWPKGEPEPTKHFLSTLPANTTLRALANTAKLRRLRQPETKKRAAKDSGDASTPGQPAPTTVQS